MLLVPSLNGQQFVNVYKNDNLATVKHVIQLPEADAIAIASCSLTRRLYLLKTAGTNSSVVHITTEGDRRVYTAPFISNLLLDNPTLTVTTTGIIVIATQRQSCPVLLKLYDQNGYLLRNTLTAEHFEVKGLIPKQSGNIVLITHSLRIGTKLTETDQTGATVREYQTRLRSNGFSLMDQEGTIMLTSRLKRIEIVDEFFNMLASNDPQLHQDETGFAMLAGEFKPLASLFTRYLLDQAHCHNLLCYNRETKDFTWIIYDDIYRANVFTRFSLR